MTPPVTSFEQLDVYKLSCALDLAVFEATKNWPKEEMYALTDQIRRSSRSVGANIAEAWAKRRYPAHFTSKLTDADGELQETKHWVMRACAYRYLSESEAEGLLRQAKEIGGKLGRMFADGSWSER